MNYKTSKALRLLGTLFLLGLCITMLSKGTPVYAAQQEPKLNVKKVDVVKDGTFRLKVYNLSEDERVIFRSSDTTIASVNSSGVVKGIGFGTATITAVVMYGDAVEATLQCEVHIGPAGLTVTFTTKSEVVMSVGRTTTVSAKVLPVNAVEKPIYYSTDTDIATVSSAGRVRAKATGIIQVYAFLSNQDVAICDVIVLSEEDYEDYLVFEAEQKEKEEKNRKTVYDFLAALEAESTEDTASAESAASSTTTPEKPIEAAPEVSSPESNAVVMNLKR